MRNMKFKMERAMQIQYVEPWDHRILKQQINYMVHLTSLDPSHPARLILDWNPCDTLDASYEYMPFRSPGRPKNKWTHFLLSFSRNAKQIDLCEWIGQLPRHTYSKQELQKEYIQYILAWMHVSNHVTLMWFWLVALVVRSRVRLTGRVSTRTVLCSLSCIFL